MYEKLGGEQSLNAVVKLLFEKMLKDGVLSSFFKKINMELLKEKFTKFLIGAFGGGGKQYIW